MATFQYKAYTAQGVITAGTIVADGADAAIDALYGSGLTPFETYGISDAQADRRDHGQAASRQSEVSIWQREFFESHRFSLKELTAFTVELATLTTSGLPLDTAFRIIAGPGAAPKTARLANELLKDVLAGAQLSEAMGRRGEIFPPDYRAILSAGEAGGVTGQVLKQIADLLVRRLEIRGKITSALLYPIILVLMSLVSVTVIVFVLIPSISPIFIDAGLPLPGILSVFADIQDNWVSVSLGTGVAAVACALIWRKVRQNDGLMLAVDRLKSALPIIGKLILAREAGGFTRALGTLLGARVPLMSAMQTARALVINRHLNALYQHAIGRVPEGTALHRAFDGTGLLPAASLRLIAVGEESGQLASMLMQVATVIEADLQRHIERMVSLLTPMLTLVVGGSIGGLIMHVMSAVLSINNLAFQ
ncbi:MULTISPECIES: type II secretion system F family protein [Bradyrhizobium]|uniref:Type II secretion system protein F (GspF) n=2 Tax=Bradyrhizobium TaxID=374 RepID=A0ABY0Q6P3_9BRAD|nr:MULTISPECIES: type II secretion system F family protein [Bradyrhizobium]SDJ60234.1 type II secretion system protein F (GspF) [Bradyrhizobium ottawaense]SEC37818.1 type II secretion system protein F (GspF) [Bradyrhizobium lablabi]SHK63088.1 type II secretion system protein F (GspF) [Bradyrhizobium lablabi]